MGLKRLIARRILLSVPTAIGVVTLIFVALLPINPVTRVVMFVTSQRELAPGGLENLVHRYGLDQPIPVQWFNWLKKVAVLDFGLSQPSGTPALELIFATLPATLELIIYSAPFILGFGIWLGTKAALNHNKLVDHVVRIVGTVGVTIPVFVLGTFLIAITMSQTGFIPIGRVSYQMNNALSIRMGNGNFITYTGMMTIDALLNKDMPLFLDAIAHLVLPVAILVFSQGVALMKVTRTGIIEESGKQYVVSARARGLSTKDSVYKHVRKNAAISVLTLSGVLLGNMLTSLVIVERVFIIHGFGNLLMSAAQNRDMAVVFAGATLVALVFVFINLIVDILYGYLDPRIRLH